MNKFEQQATSLRGVLEAYGFGKSASETVRHMNVLDQNNLGKEQQKDQVANTPGMQASDPANAQTDKLGPTSEPGGIQDKVTDGQAALKATGTTVNTVNSDGTAGSLNQVKSAAAYRQELAQLIALSKQSSAAAPAPAAAPAATAPVAKQAAAAPAQPQAPNPSRQLAQLIALNKQAKQAPVAEVPQIMTGTAVFQKIASVGPTATEAQQQEIYADLQKLASTNPVFAICFEQAKLRKMAEDAMELAKEQGISPEEAAQALDAAISQDPSAAAELDNEAAGEAVSDLADGEAQTQGLIEAANGASELVGQEITPEDLLGAADDVAAAAEQLQVPPEAIVQAALDQMMSEGAGPEPTAEDQAQADAILANAAQQGVSPEEVLQQATSLMQEQPAAQPGEGQPAAEQAPAPAEPAQEEPKKDTPVEKAASLQKLSGTVRGKLALANLAGKRK